MLSSTKPLYVEGKKHSKTPLGLLPWVTAILSETGDKEAFKRWEEKVGYLEVQSIRKMSALRGKDLDRNITNFFESGVIANCPLFEQAWHVIKEFDDHVCWQKFVYHPAGYCGRLDYLGRNESGYCLIDWKSSERAKIDKFMIDPRLQVAANLKAAEYTLKIPISRGEVVVCVVSREVPQRFPIAPNEIEPLWQEFLDRLDKYRSMFGDGF